MPKMDVEADKIDASDDDITETVEVDSAPVDDSATPEGDSLVDKSASSKTLINLEDLRHAGLDEDDLQILH